MTDRNIDIHCIICKNYMFSVYPDADGEVFRKVQAHDLCKLKHPILYKRELEKNKKYITKLNAEREQYKKEEKERLTKLFNSLSKRK